MADGQDLLGGLGAGLHDPPLGAGQQEPPLGAGQQDLPPPAAGGQEELYLTIDSPLLRAKKLYYVNVHPDPECILCICLADHQFSAEEPLRFNNLSAEEGALLRQCHYLLATLEDIERIRYNDMETHGDGMVYLGTLLEDIEKGEKTSISTTQCLMLLHHP